MGIEIFKNQILIFKNLKQYNMEEVDTNEPLEAQNHKGPPVTEAPKVAEEKQPPPEAGTCDAAPKRRGGRVSLNRGDLTEKEECPDCKKVLSKHSLIYNTHKCAAKARKNIVIENIEAPVAKAAVAPTKQIKQEPPQFKQPTLPRNYIDLDGDTDYSHLNAHIIFSGYVSFTRAKEKEFKQQKYRSMLHGRL